MWLETPSLRAIPFLLCLLFFLMRPGETLDTLSIDQKTLDKIITPFIIGAVLGEMHNQATKKEEEEDNRGSAQEQHPVYIPLSWHQSLPRQSLPPPPLPLQQQQPPPPPPLPFHHHHPHMVPLIPLPFHPHHHHHPHHHPLSQLHHPRAHPSITLIPHELVPLFHHHVFEHLIHQMQHPIMNHQHIHGMQGMHSFEIIEKLPIHQWLPPISPHANPMFQSLNYGSLLNHKLH